MAAKKKVAKKKVIRKKVATRAKSRATGKPPSTRLKARRAKNTSEGYCPNPLSELFLIKIVKGDNTYYFDGEGGDKNKNNAALYRTQAAAVRIAQKVSESITGIAVYVEGIILKKK